MKFISLFAGIGGFDLGFERAGMECIAQVEIDGFCQKVLAKHWPNVPRYGDIRDVGKHNLPKADVICGGFPCQPHSLAGKRKGAQDDRNLWPEYFRIVTELKPTWIVGENVPGIRTTILDNILSDLESEEYTTRVLIIPACAFNACHRRDRVFIIAYANSKHSAEYLSWCQSPKKIQPPEAGSSYLDSDWRSAASRLLRMDDGFPNRMDRCRIERLGNAVVPQVAEFIGNAIMEVELRA